MTVDTFLQFPTKSLGGSNIQLLGESLDAKFKDALEINSFSLGVENPTTIASTTGGATTGKVQFNEFTVSKVVDRASPSLFQVCCTASHFPEAVLSIRKSGVAAGEPYLIYNFAMVFCTRMEWAGGGSEVPLESVTFAYGKLKITYMQQDPTGKLGAPSTATWSQIMNKSEYSPQ